MTSHPDSVTAAATRRLAQTYVATVLAVAGAGMLATAIWAWAAPRSFARFVAFPYHEHFLYDLGAFRIGIGVTLLLALVWQDAPMVALAGFLVANSLHGVSHAMDLDLGRASDPYAIGAVSLLVRSGCRYRPQAFKDQITQHRGWLGAACPATAARELTQRSTQAEPVSQLGQPPASRVAERPRVNNDDLKA